MKRSPLRRNTPLRSTTPLKPVSKKRAKELRERTKMIRQLMAERPRCQAGPRIIALDEKFRCYIQPSDVHEPLTRARGGSITDPDNALVVCRACHDWIHAHPAEALRIGLLRSGYGETL